MQTLPVSYFRETVTFERGVPVRDRELMVEFKPNYAVSARYFTLATGLHLTPPQLKSLERLAAECA